MRVYKSSISFDSQHIYSENHQKTEYSRVWNDKTGEFKETEKLISSSYLVADSAVFSDASIKESENNTQTNAAQSEKTEGFSLEPSEQDKQKIELIRQILERFTGRKIELYQLENCAGNSKVPVQNTSESVQNTDEQNRQGWGAIYQKAEIFSEEEHTSFSASGTVTDSNGNEIELRVNFSLDRAFHSESVEETKLGDALIDPLVINFDCLSAELGSEKIQFDIDSDGKDDLISFLKGGSGFLTIDRNDNNIADDGSELFGTRNGNGFLELSEYDEDKNGWIDEGDSIFNKLRIWTKDAEGNDMYFTLAEKDVGALYLAAENTEFMLKSDEARLNGAIRQSSVFLKESGGAGTVQHVDLAV